MCLFSIGVTRKNRVEILLCTLYKYFSEQPDALKSLLPQMRNVAHGNVVA